MIRLAELAAQLGLAVEGDGDLRLVGVASLEDAGDDDLVFVRSEQYAAKLLASGARAVVAPEGFDVGGRSALRSPDPARDFHRAARLLVPEPEPEPGVHPSAVVDPSAMVDPTASVGATCVVGRAARVGARSVLHPGVVLSDGVMVGEDCELGARCVVVAASILGDRVRLQPGVVIGGQGFGLTGAEGGGLARTHDLGRVRIGDEVEIGANSTVDRGTLGETRIGAGTKIDNLVQIAHNCVLGEDCIVTAQTGIGGSTHLGDRVVVMAQAGIAGHLELEDGSVVGPQAGLHKNVASGEHVIGTPQRSMRSWSREMAALSHLPELLRRVRRLERERE